MKNIIRKMISAVLAAAVIFMGTAYLTPTQMNASALSIPMDSITRIAGASRIDTACAMAEKIKKLTGSVDSVVIANGNSYTDALAAVPFAYEKKAPILLSTVSASGEKLEDSNLKEIRTLGAKSIYLIGGTSAISTAVENSLKESGYNVTRIYGQNRYESAVRVSEKLTLRENTVFIVSGENFPDALSAAPIAAMKGAAILYGNSAGTLDSNALNYLKGRGIKTAYIVGGPMAVGEKTESALRSAGVTSVQRIYGDTRYDTSYKVYMSFKPAFSAQKVCYATGGDFPDALSGGVYAALSKSPLFLLSYNGRNDEAARYVKAYGLGDVTVFGGFGAVSQLTLGYIYDSGFSNSFELNVNGATGYALKSLPISGTSVSIPAGTAFKILSENGSNLTVSYKGVHGSVPAIYCLINMPDVMPGLIYKLSNANGSLYQSTKNGTVYPLNGITGSAIYGISKVYNARLMKNEYIVPVMYTAAKKIAIAEKKAFLDGNTIVIYDAYRPYSVTQKITTVYSAMVSKGCCGDLTKYGFNSSWFLATKLSTHNFGAAVDVSLADAATGIEKQMPTVMHELSTAAAKYQGPGSTSYAPTMNANAKLLHSYFSTAGMNPIESEWWHFEVRKDYDTVKGSRGISNNWYPTALS